MSPFRTALPGIAPLALLALLAACDQGGPTADKGGSTYGPEFTLASGSSSTLLGRATFAEGFDVKRKSDDWQLQIKAKDPTDVAVQRIFFKPHGNSGWHSHPGPVLIQVVYGRMTFYEGDDPSCTPIVRTAGQAYLDAGEHAHIARNETADSAVNVVTYLAPVAAKLRIDEPAPGNCPF